VPDRSPCLLVPLDVPQATTSRQRNY
jgi:hypothetical protein